MKVARALATIAVMLAVGLLVLAAIADVARADTKHVTWINATANTDSSAIPATGAGSLVRTTVEYGTCTSGNAGIAVKSGEISVVAPQTMLDLSLVVVQQFCLQAFHSNTFATTFAACLNGTPGTATCPVGNSARSNVAITTVLPPQPSPPASLTVVAGAQTAYTFSLTDDFVVGLEAGTANVGATCDPTQGMIDKAHGQLYLVPLAQVTLLHSIKAKAVFAKCTAG